MAGHASVREVRNQELEAVLALWSEAYGTVGVTDSLDDILQAASGSTSVLLVAEEEGRIVGTVIGGFDGWRGNSYRLAVHPDSQRRGIARRLVSALEARLGEMGAKRITALVERDHPWATGFWDTVGYALDGGNGEVRAQPLALADSLPWPGPCSARGVVSSEGVPKGPHHALPGIPCSPVGPASARVPSKGQQPPHGAGHRGGGRVSLQMRGFSLARTLA